jgi:hypothetical protein
MKKLKVVIFVLAIVAILSSCNENSIAPVTDEQTLTESQVPSAVQSTLNTNFPTATNTSWSLASPSVYQASFQTSGTSRLASIASSGRMLHSYTEIDPATLPSAITTYLETNYLGYSIKKAGSKTDSTGAVSGYVVRFSLNSLSYEIRFDGTGSFLSLEVRDGSKQCSEIAKADLPTNTLTYLDSAYSGYTFNHARINKTNGVTSGYGVEITYNSAKVRLLFDAAGSFVSLDTKDGRKNHGSDSSRGHGKGKGGVSTPIDQANLLPTIVTYLNTNYAGYTFVSAASFSDGTTIKRYSVKITHQSNSYKLEFDATGNFLRVH